MPATTHYDTATSGKQQEDREGDGVTEGVSVMETITMRVHFTPGTLEASL